MSILDYTPEGYQLRDVQKQVLLEVEENWNEHDVFVVDAPVSCGKSLISVIISNWRAAMDETSAILTPRSLLQDQYQRDFSHIPSLKGKGKYSCNSKGYSTCGEFHEIAGYHCNNCPYKEAVSEAVESDQVILNFHSHLFSGMVNDMYKDLLIVDEAHNLVPMLSDIYTLNIWQHKENYPYDTHTKDDIIMWLSDEIAALDVEIKRVRAIYNDSDKMPKRVRKSMLDASRKFMRYKMIKSGLVLPQELFNIAKVERVYGKSRKVQECIEVKPISLKTVPHQMWPDGEVKKLVLLSATIYDKDIDRLGIKRKRVKYIKCGSPIPATQRPIIISGMASMSYNSLAESTKVLSSTIKSLSNKHQGKGIIHITYGLIKYFKKHLKGDRYIWHTEETREEAYKQFIESDGNEILMACGMGEGIDLAGEDFEWQVIAKTMFASLADPLQKHFLNKDPIVYTLNTVRSTVQQVGRICRTPTDYGITYILDSNFAKFYKRSTRLADGKYKPHYELFPDYFVEAMVWKQLDK